MSVRAVGDFVVVEGSDATRLYGAHGLVAEYRALSTAAHDAAHPATTCLAPGGAAIAVVDGAVEPIEGPTNVVAIVPHPRGVVAFADARALVVDVERGAW